MGGANLRIAQVNVVDPEELLARRDALEESMRVANDKTDMIHLYLSLQTS